MNCITLARNMSVFAFSAICNISSQSWPGLYLFATTRYWFVLITTLRKKQRPSGKTESVDDDAVGNAATVDWSPEAASDVDLDRCSDDVVPVVDAPSCCCTPMGKSRIDIYYILFDCHPMACILGLQR